MWGKGRCPDSPANNSESQWELGSFLPFHSTELIDQPRGEAQQKKTGRAGKTKRRCPAHKYPSPATANCTTHSGPLLMSRQQFNITEDKEGTLCPLPLGNQQSPRHHSLAGRATFESNHFGGLAFLFLVRRTQLLNIQRLIQIKIPILKTCKQPCTSRAAQFLL